MNFGSHNENDENIRNHKKRAKKSLIPDLRMSVYNKVGALAIRAIGEFPSSNNLKLQNLVESLLEITKTESCLIALSAMFALEKFLLLCLSPRRYHSNYPKE